MPKSKPTGPNGDCQLTPAPMEARRLPVSPTLGPEGSILPWLPKSVKTLADIPSSGGKPEGKDNCIEAK